MLRRALGVWVTAAWLGCGLGCGQPDPSPCGDCTLRQAAELADVRVGVAAAPGDAEWNAVILREFDALSPESELVWDRLHPEPEEWVFEPADEVLAFADDNALFTTASHFVWDQSSGVSGTPPWVEEITDPDELEATMRAHLEAVTERYGDRIDRWIVVNEPLEYFGPDLYANHFHQVLGPEYIATALRMAREIAPGSERWLNEIFTESNPDKCAALIALARDLLEQGAPLDGVGLQGHLFPNAPDFELVEQTLRSLADLGLSVAITELDAPVNRGPDSRFELHAERMAAMVRACLAVPACDSVTVWGLHDGVSWLNGLLGPGKIPLLFDESLEPKESYFRVRDALLEGRP